MQIDRARFESEFLDPLDEHRNWDSGRLERTASWQDFDPAALWAALEAEYGGEAGIDQARRQCAQALVEAFSLRADSPMDLRGGRLLLRCRVWIDDFDKKYSGRNVVSINSADRLQKALEALAGAAGFLAAEPTAQAMRAFESQFHRRGRQIESRQRFELGEVRVTTYLQRFEFLLAPSLSQALPVFLATWAPEAFAKAA